MFCGARLVLAPGRPLPFSFLRGRGAPFVLGPFVFTPEVLALDDPTSPFPAPAKLLVVHYPLGPLVVGLFLTVTIALFPK